MPKDIQIFDVEVHLPGREKNQIKSFFAHTDLQPAKHANQRF